MKVWNRGVEWELGEWYQLGFFSLFTIAKGLHGFMFTLSGFLNIERHEN
jgi:hypothetical protein